MSTANTASATNDSVAAVSDALSEIDGDDRELPGRAIDPELLDVLRRVAHREHLFAGAAPRIPSNRPERRRPVSVSNVSRSARGTTARKVTWSR